MEQGGDQDRDEDPVVQPRPSRAPPAPRLPPTPRARQAPRGRRRRLGPARPRDASRNASRNASRIRPGAEPRGPRGPSLTQEGGSPDARRSRLGTAGAGTGVSRPGRSPRRPCVGPRRLPEEPPPAAQPPVPDLPCETSWETLNLGCESLNGFLKVFSKQRDGPHITRVTAPPDGRPAGRGLSRRRSQAPRPPPLDRLPAGHGASPGLSGPGAPPQASNSASTGTWSEGWFQPRAGRRMRLAPDRSARSGVAQTWSSRRPLSAASQSGAR